ncbi:hypothetical protein JCM10450v2_002298 [Rhodotorula kratochvilovae]
MSAVEQQVQAPEEPQDEPTFRTFVYTVVTLTNWAKSLPENANRLDQIDAWTNLMTGGKAHERYVRLSKWSREGLVAQVAGMSAYFTVPAHEPLNLDAPMSSSLSANVVARARPLSHFPAPPHIVEPSVYHRDGLEVDPYMHHHHRPLPSPSLPPPVPAPLYSPLRTPLVLEPPPDLPIPRLERTFSLGFEHRADPSTAPPPPAFLSTFPANPGVPRLGFEREHEHGREGVERALGRRAARYYGTTPGRWRRGEGW